MAAPNGLNIQKVRVLDSATVVAATNKDSSMVDVLGAKAVYFIVRSTTAGETDAFTVPGLIGTVSGDAGATLVVADPSASNALGVMSANRAACVTAGNQGFILAVFPEGIGTDAGATPEGGRFACSTLGIRIGAHATNDISTVVADALVIY